MHLCISISYIQTITMIKFISCTDGPQATGPVANVICILYKLLQLIKNIKVSGGGLIVTLGATALKGKVTGI